VFHCALFRVCSPFYHIFGVHFHQHAKRKKRQKGYNGQPLPQVVATAESFPLLF
jgi:hypothetical protein